MEIAHIIADLRIQNKLSQRELANAMNVSPGVIGSWETGRILPGFESCIALADFFAISMDVLFEKDRSLAKSQYGQNDLTTDEKKIVDIFKELDVDNKDILIGRGKELLKEQRLEEKREVKKQASRMA
ncbi:MAG: helix-turn-helix transcriptional regulator [Lachnospiraceae bacterium]|nr:helix-turn-helix transcriptional regulator [Lachnospiraceae bacterium]